MKPLIFIAKNSMYSFPIPTAVRRRVYQSRLIKVQFTDFNKMIHLRTSLLSMSKIHLCPTVFQA